jgi:uncharacterized protein YkwD
VFRRDPACSIWQSAGRRIGDAAGMERTGRRRAGLPVLWLCAAVAACGGGGGGADDDPPPLAAAPTPSPSPSPSAPPSPSPSPSPAPAPSPGTRATCNLPDFDADALALVNAHRAAGADCGSRGRFAAAPSLSWNAALTQASLVHSDDMMAGNFFSHTGSNGSSAGDRATAAGYAWSAWGENIAAGQTTVAGVVAAWMASPGHCANIMNATLRDIGLACVAGSASNTYRTYWTMTLGAQR